MPTYEDIQQRLAEKYMGRQDQKGSDFPSFEAVQQRLAQKYGRPQVPAPPDVPQSVTSGGGMGELRALESQTGTQPDIRIGPDGQRYVRVPDSLRRPGQPEWVPSGTIAAPSQAHRTRMALSQAAGQAAEKLEYGAQGLAQGLMIPEAVAGTLRRSGIDIRPEDLLRPAETPGQRAAEFSGQVVGLLGPTLLAGVTGGAAAGVAGGAATQAALRALGPRAAASAAGRLAARVVPGIAAGAGTGATIGAAQQAARELAVPEEADLQQRLGEVLESAGYFAAYGAAYPAAGAIVGRVEQLLGRTLPETARQAIANALTRRAPAVPEVARAGIEGTVAGGLVGLGPGVATFARTGDLEAARQAVVGEAGQELQEELVESIAYRIAQALSGGRMQAPVEARQAPQQEVTPDQNEGVPPPQQAAPVQAPTPAQPPQPLGPSQPTQQRSREQTRPSPPPQKQALASQPMEGPAQAQTPLPMDRAQAIRDAIPGIDERSVVSLEAATRDLSDEEFQGLMERQKTLKPSTPSAATQPESKRGLPPVQDNFRKSLAAYTPVLYRETNADGALTLIPESNTAADVSREELYFANTPDLALGQAQNKGIMLEFDADPIQGQVNTSKPAWEIAYQNGQAEFRARLNPQSAYQKAVRRITVRPDAKMSKVDRLRLKATLKQLEQQGWVKSVNQDGGQTYTRPDVAEQSATIETIATSPAVGKTVVGGQSQQKPIWQMTRAEAVGDPPTVPDPPRPLEKRYGKNWRERPDAEALLRQYRQEASARQRAIKQYKQYVEKSNAHLSAVEDAMSQGKSVPPEVLAEYPHLQQRTPEEVALERLRQKVQEETGEGLAEERGSLRLPAGARRAEQQEPNPFAFENEETERRWQEAKGLRKPPLLQTVREILTRAKHVFTREYEHLPRTKEHARFRFLLQQLSKGKGVASDRALKHIQAVTVRLDVRQYDLFTRKVILDDLMEELETQRRRNEERKARGQEPLGIRLPFDFTPESLEKEHAHISQGVEANPAVKEAIEDRKFLVELVRTDYMKAAEDAIGWAPPLNRKDYYRHQVLAYAELAGGPKGTGQKLKAPTKRGFLRERVGSELDINTEYLQAEYEWMSQMLFDTQVYQTLKFVKDHYDISAELREQAKQQNANWRDLIPEGYTVWTPVEGGLFYKAWSVPEKFIQKALDNASEALDIPVDELRQIVAVGGRRGQIVIPEEVAETLNHFGRDPRRNVIDDVLRAWLRWWKQWQLLSPRRVLKYNLRNVSGDLDATLATNPRALLKVPRAVNELWQFVVQGGAPAKELDEWLSRGGMQDVLQVAENMGDIKGLSLFWNLDQSGGLSAQSIMKRLFQWPRKLTDFRESILRYAHYLEYVEQIEKNGRPLNYGASLREEVDALPDPRDKAYKLANDALGNYDEITVAGQFLRERIFPFWSWTEVNTRRYYRLLKNAVEDGKAMSAIGRAAAGKLAGITVRSPLIAYQIGKLVVMSYAFAGLTAAWNYIFFRDEEEELPEDVKRRPHIIFGRDADGKIIYFNRLGALHDFLEWFGLADAGQYVQEYLNGRRTLAEIVRDIAITDANKLYQSWGPSSTLLDLITGHNRYPDVRRPRPIRDRVEFLADELGLGDEYRELAGRPTRGYGASLKKLVVYELDPGEAAYYDVLSLKSRFRREVLGVPGGVYEPNPKGNALYWFKQAVRYGDGEAARKYLLEYAKYGGTSRGLQQSLRSLHPLYGLSEENQRRFIEWLNQEERERLKRALSWYDEVLAP